jgi:ferredoxin--NADP+ reductase
MTDWCEAKVVDKKCWTDRLVSLRFDAGTMQFRAGQFLRIGLDIDGERVGRPYSFVNAPHEASVEIYFNTLPEGPLSPRLAALEPGDRLWADRNANGMLTLDEVPDVRHLWLLATGTAIGPFLSILKTDAPWARFEKVILVHGVRTAEELTYSSTLERLQANHPQQLRFVPFVSREQRRDALHGRIPAGIESGRLEAAADTKLSADESHIMLCGNKGMINAVQQLLAGRGMKRHRRLDPGHISTESYY